MKKFLRFLGRILLGLLLLTLLVGLTVGGVLAVKGWKLYRSTMEEMPLSQRVENARQTPGYVPLEEMPELYPEMVVAVEDHRYYRHGAVDLISLARAVAVNLYTGDYTEGGSTITQQLAKTLCFTQEKRLERKAAEFFAAWALERNYTKEEILELYINTIYYGSGYTGLTAAAKGYFGCEASSLSLLQSTLLVGIPNAPSRYSPDEDPELTLQRQAQVLRILVKQKVFAQEQADTLAEEAAEVLAVWRDAV